MKEAANLGGVRDAELFKDHAGAGCFELRDLFAKNKATTSHTRGVLRTPSDQLKGVVGFWKQRA
jgi:hypothetical protein